MHPVSGSCREPPPAQALGRVTARASCGDGASSTGVGRVTLEFSCEEWSVISDRGTARPLVIANYVRRPFRIGSAHEGTRRLPAAHSVLAESAADESARSRPAEVGADPRGREAWSLTKGG